MVKIVKPIATLRRIFDYFVHYKLDIAGVVWRTVYSDTGGRLCDRDH